jgi:hypothetical protein
MPELSDSDVAEILSECPNLGLFIITIIIIIIFIIIIIIIIIIINELNLFLHIFV